MPEEIKNRKQQVERSYEGKYYAFWRGHIVYEHQRIGSGVLKRNAPLGTIFPSRCPRPTRLGGFDGGLRGWPLSDIHARWS